MIKEDN